MTKLRCKIKWMGKSNSCCGMNSPRYLYCTALIEDNGNITITPIYRCHLSLLPDNKWENDIGSCTKEQIELIVSLILQNLQPWMKGSQIEVNGELYAT